MRKSIKSATAVGLIALIAECGMRRSLRGLVVVGLVASLTACGGEPAEMTTTTSVVTAGDRAACAIFNSESEESRAKRQEIESKGAASGLDMSIATTGYRDAASSALQRAESVELIDKLGTARRLSEAAFQVSGNPSNAWDAVEAAWAAVDAATNWCGQ